MSRFPFRELPTSLQTHVMKQMSLGNQVSLLSTSKAVGQDTELQRTHEDTFNEHTPSVTDAPRSMVDAYHGNARKAVKYHDARQSRRFGILSDAFLYAMRTYDVNGFQQDPYQRYYRGGFQHAGRHFEIAASVAWNGDVSVTVTTPDWGWTIQVFKKASTGEFTAISRYFRRDTDPQKYIRAFKKSRIHSFLTAQ